MVKMKKYLACLLSAAMVLTSFSVPTMAAPVAEESVVGEAAMTLDANDSTAALTDSGDTTFKKKYGSTGFYEYYKSGTTDLVVNAEAEDTTIEGSAYTKAFKIGTGNTGIRFVAPTTDTYVINMWGYSNPGSTSDAGIKLARDNDKGEPMKGSCENASVTFVKDQFNKKYTLEYDMTKDANYYLVRDGSTTVYVYKFEVVKKGEDVTPTTYEVKFMNGDTQVGTTQSITSGSDANVPAALDDTETHTFGGWAATAGSTTVAVAKDATKVENITENKTYYAIWTARTTPTGPENPGSKEDTVSVNFVDGESPVKTYTVSANTPVDVPTLKDTDTATFMGWATTKGDTTVAIAKDATTVTATEDKTYYAIWEAKNPTTGVTYTVTFKVEGQADTTVTVSGNATIGDQMPADPTAPAGKKFAGWFADGKEVKADTVVTANMTVTAKFEDATKPQPEAGYVPFELKESDADGVYYKINDVIYADPDGAFSFIAAQNIKGLDADAGTKVTFDGKEFSITNKGVKSGSFNNAKVDSNTARVLGYIKAEKAVAINLVMKTNGGKYYYIYDTTEMVADLDKEKTHVFAAADMKITLNPTDTEYKVVSFDAEAGHNYYIIGQGTDPMAFGLITVSTSGDDCEHSYKEDTTKSVAATCTEAGKKVEVCEKCDTEKTTPIPALGHSYKEDATKSVAATCTVDGKKVEVCERCNDEKPTTIPATGHTKSGKGTVTKAATCTEAGELSDTCTVCGEKFIEVIDALGHKWDEGKVTKAATETEEGVKTFTCEVCGETETEVIPAKKNEPSKGDDKQGDDEVVTPAEGTPLTPAQESVASGKEYVNVAGKLDSKTEFKDEKVYMSDEDTTALLVTGKKGKIKTLKVSAVEGYSVVTVESKAKIVLPGTANYAIVTDNNGGINTKGTSSKSGKVSFKKKTQESTFTAKNVKNAKAEVTVKSADGKYIIKINIIPVKFTKEIKKAVVTAGDGYIITPVDGTDRTKNPIKSGIWMVGKNIVKEYNKEVQMDANKKGAKITVKILPTGALQVVKADESLTKGSVKFTYIVNNHKYTTTVKYAAKGASVLSKSKAVAGRQAIGLK